MNPCKIAIIEDDQDIREGIEEFLSSQANYRVSQAVASVEDFLRDGLKQDRPDIILMDIELPGMSGIDGMQHIKTACNEIEIIMLTIYHEASKIFKSLCAGASGYLLKNTPPPQIVLAIDELRNGGAPMSPQIARKVIGHFCRPQQAAKENSLTPREREVVTGLVDGLSYKLIAARMSISLETVRQHIKNIYEKLHVHSKAEVISRSLRGEL